MPSLSKIGRVSAEKEIAELSAKVKELIDSLEGLHGKSIDALASEGFVNDRFRLIDLLKVAKEAAQSAHFSNADELDGRGRKLDFLARGVSRILAFDYAELTGKPPTVTTDSYLPGHPRQGRVFGVFAGCLYGFRHQVKPRDMGAQCRPSMAGDE